MIWKAAETTEYNVIYVDENSCYTLGECITQTIWRCANMLKRRLKVRPTYVLYSFTFLKQHPRLFPTLI